jgi:hypothetical protein
MRSASWFALLVSLVLWAQATPAAACKCAPPDVRLNYDSAELALKVLVLGELPTAPRAGVRRYIAATLDEAYKGCTPRHALVIVETKSDSAACGVTFEPGSQQLLFASSLGSRFGLPLLSTGACSGNREWSGLTEAERHFLATRYNCCGDDCGCVDSQLVECLVDPCTVSTCAVPDAVCRANYCGGCKAEWYLPQGLSATSCDAAERPAPVAPCRHAGCSGQLCIGPNDEEPITTCEVRPEYACLRWTTCEPQTDGGCGFTPSTQYDQCVAAAKRAP